MSRRKRPIGDVLMDASESLLAVAAPLPLAVLGLMREGRPERETWIVEALGVPALEAAGVLGALSAAGIIVSWSKTHWKLTERGEAVWKAVAPLLH